MSDPDRALLLRVLVEERFRLVRLPEPGGPEVITLAHLRTQLETYEARRKVLSDALDSRPADPWAAPVAEDVA